MKNDDNIKRAIEHIGFEPKCICGNSVEFITKLKTTPYGGWRQYCSRSCMYKDPKTAEKRKQTMLSRYGVDSFSKVQVFEKWSDETKKNYNEKRKQTALSKYGVEHFSKTQEYLDKRTKTNQEKYGVDNTFALVEEENRRGFFSSEAGKNWLKSDSNQGLEYLKINREQKLLSKIKNQNIVCSIIQKDYQSLSKYIIQIADAQSNPNRFSIANEIGLSTSYLNLLMRKCDIDDLYVSNISFSNGEREISDFLNELKIEYRLHDRRILHGKELDFVIDSHQLAIEYNGVYWHSEGCGGKDKLYHVNKTNQCESYGYQLLHILDTEWINPDKQKIWKSIIKAKLGLIENKIYSRKCDIRNISPKESREFLDVNHLEGFSGAKIHMGLFYHDVLVSVMSFGKSRFSKNEYEIIRFASILNHVVVGGYSKLLKSYNLNDKLISFANRRFSSNLISNKFAIETSISGPTWYGFNTKDYELKHRLSFTKKNLQNLFEYDDNISSFDNMLAHGYDRIWDSGNLKHTLK